MNPIDSLIVHFGSMSTNVMTRIKPPKLNARIFSGGKRLIGLKPNSMGRMKSIRAIVRSEIMCWMLDRQIECFGSFAFGGRENVPKKPEGAQFGRLISKSRHKFAVPVNQFIIAEYLAAIAQFADHVPMQG